MYDENPFRSPRSDSSPRSWPTDDVGQGIWRDGNVLVLRKDAVLPDRCIACNEPANGRRWNHTFYWHSPVYYFLLLLYVFVYVIVALIVRKSAKFDLGICQRHQRQRTNAIFISLSAMPIAVLGAVVASRLRTGQLALFLASAGILLLSIVFLSARRDLVNAKRIDRNFVWLKGAHREFLAACSDWPGPMDALRRDSPRESSGLL